jgi:hypothetical protein
MSQVTLALSLNEAALLLSALRKVTAETDNFHLLESVADTLEAGVTAAETNVPDDEPFDGFRTDAEADADVFASAGWGTDEDYGSFSEDY